MTFVEQVNQAKEEIYNESLHDLNIDLNNFEGGLRVLSIKRSKWSRRLFEEELKSAELEERLKELYSKKYKYYLYEHKEDGKNIEKKYVEMWVNSDKEYLSLDYQYKVQKSKEKLVAQVLNAVDQQSFSYSTILKKMMYEGSKFGTEDNTSKSKDSFISERTSIDNITKRMNDE